MEPVAHYKTWRALISVAVCFGVFVGSFYLPIGFDNGHIIKLAASPEHRTFLMPVLFIAWLCAIYSLFLGGVILRQILFNHAIALWIDEDDTLIFLDKWLFSLKCRDIDSFTMGRDGIAKSVAIIVWTRNRQRKAITTTNLKESPKEIVKCLEEKLSLCKKA